MVLRDTGITKHLVLPIYARTATVLVVNARIGARVEVGIGDVAAKDAGETVLVAAQQLVFILVLHVIFHAQQIQFPAQAVKADKAVVADLRLAGLTGLGGDEDNAV